jgi:3-oxoadipate enol-lactonase
VSQKPTSYINTAIGKIAIYQKDHDSRKTPIIFLHGVYFDHHLWDKIIESINDRTVITLDMPLHGLSKDIIKYDWTLKDCAEMLLEVLAQLKFEKVLAIGHSWGSMTILRAASLKPDRFSAIGFCNMPFEAASKRQKLLFALQHSMLSFRAFYTRQTGKALFGRSSLKSMPSLLYQLKRPMDLLTNTEVKRTDKAVILNAENSSDLIKNLKVKAYALKGVEDYVSTPTGLITKVVGGGHVTPLEKPEEIFNLIIRLQLLM